MHLICLCVFFLIKNHDLIEKYVALILSKGLIMYSEKRLLIWFQKKEINIKKIYPFLSALYSITTDRHGIWIVNKYVFSPYFFMSFLVKQFVYIHNEIKRLKHALWRQKHSLFIESIQSKWYVAAKLSII